MPVPVSDSFPSRRGGCSVVHPADYVSGRYAMFKKLSVSLLIAALACALALCAGCGATGVGATASMAGNAASDAIGVGEHEVDVALSGGTGQASISSPAKLVVAEDGSMTRVNVWLQIT